MGLSIIIPAHNEEGTIARTLFSLTEELTKADNYEIIVVNDRSSDKTTEVVKDAARLNHRIRLIDNKGKGFADALLAGFGASYFDKIIPVMADRCDDISAIKEMGGKMAEGFDVVCGARYVKRGKRLGGSKIKAFFSWFVGKSIYFSTRIPTRDVSNAFKMYRKDVIDNISIESKGFEVSMEITLKAYFGGYSIAEIPTVWRERAAGKSNFKMWKAFPHYLRWYLWAIGKRITRIFS